MLNNPFWNLSTLWTVSPKCRGNPSLATVKRGSLWVEKYTQGFRLIHYRTTLVDATPNGFEVVGHASATSQRNLAQFAGIPTWRRDGDMMRGRIMLTRGAVRFDSLGKPLGDPYVWAAPKDIAKLDRIYGVLAAPDMPMAAGGQTWGECKALLGLLPGEARSAVRAVMKRWTTDAFPMSKLTHEVMHHAIVGASNSTAAGAHRRSELEALASRYDVKLNLS